MNAPTKPSQRRSPAPTTEVVLEARGLTKHFAGPALVDRLVQRSHRVVHAVDDVNLMPRRGRVTALVGESGPASPQWPGCWPSLYPRTSGDILLHGESGHRPRWPAVPRTAAGCR